MSPRNTSEFSNISNCPADFGSILTDNFKSTLSGTEKLLPVIRHSSSIYSSFPNFKTHVF